MANLLPAVTAVNPNPVILPYGGQVNLVVTGRMEDDGVPVSDQVGTMQFRHPGPTGEVLFTATITVDVPDVPWPAIACVPVDVTDVQVANNGGGSYTVTHTP